MTESVEIIREQAIPVDGSPGGEAGTLKELLITYTDGTHSFKIIFQTDTDTEVLFDSTISNQKIKNLELQVQCNRKSIRHSHHHNNSCGSSSSHSHGGCGGGSCSHAERCRHNQVRPGHCYPFSPHAKYSCNCCYFPSSYYPIISSHGHH
jgi:hypothetical protein